MKHQAKQKDAKEDHISKNHERVLFQLAEVQLIPIYLFIITCNWRSSSHCSWPDAYRLNYLSNANTQRWIRLAEGITTPPKPFSLKEVMRHANDLCWDALVFNLRGSLCLQICVRLSAEFFGDTTIFKIHLSPSVICLSAQTLRYSSKDVKERIWRPFLIIQNDRHHLKLDGRHQ
jgi:hypothetical protein